MFLKSVVEEAEYPHIIEVYVTANDYFEVNEHIGSFNYERDADFNIITARGTPPVANWVEGVWWSDNTAPPSGVQMNITPVSTVTVPVLGFFDTYIPMYPREGIYGTIVGDFDYLLTLSGTPTETGVYNLAIGYTYGGAAGEYDWCELILHVVSEPQINTTNFPKAVKGKPYSAKVDYNGTEPITWAITNGALPTGLTLNSDTGEISGTIN